MKVSEGHDAASCSPGRGQGSQKAGVELLYSIYLFESNSTVQNLLSEDVILKEVVTDNLKPNTTYYWYVVAKHEGNRVANSPTWTFKTGEK